MLTYFGSGFELLSWTSSTTNKKTKRKFYNFYPILHSKERQFQKFSNSLKIRQQRRSYLICIFLLNFIFMIFFCWLNGGFTCDLKKYCLLQLIILMEPHFMFVFLFQWNQYHNIIAQICEVFKRHRIVD